jgi:molecular chaperone GrpE (heat shock protein)
VRAAPKGKDMADIAQLGIQVTTNGSPQRATDELNKLSGAATKAEDAVEGLRKSTGGAVGSVNAAARAYSDGAVSATKSTSALVAMNSAVNDNARSATGFTSQARMMALQLSQVAQQTQVTGNFLQSLAIQLPDLALGFGPIGIAAGIAAGAALSYFSSITSNGPESAAALKQQAELIQDVADRWGAAVPALQDYVNELERAKNVGDLTQAYDALEKFNWDTVRAPLEDINVQFADLILKLQDAGEKQMIVDNLDKAFQSLRDGVANGTASVAQLQSVQDALTASMQSTGIKAVNDFTDAFSGLANQIFRAANEADRLSQERLNALTTGLNGPKLGSLGPLWSDNGQIMKPEDFVPRDTPTPSRRPLVELEGLGGSSRTPRASNDNYKSSLLSIQERTKAIEAETTAQAALNPLVNDYGFAITKARTSADLLAAAEKAKKDITPDLIAQIDQTSSALARATAEQNKQNEAVQQYKQYVDFLKSTTAGFVNDLRNGLRSGQGLWESFGKAALNVLDRITDRLLNQVLDAVFQVSSAGTGGSGGGGILGFLGGLFGGGGGSSGFDLGAGATAYSGPSLPKFAAGTSSAPRGVAWVGEKGPELVRFKGGEEVIPNHRLQVPANQNAGSMKAGDIHIDATSTIDARGADSEAVARLQAAQARRDAELPSKIIETVKEAQRRRIIN